MGNIRKCASCASIIDPEDLFCKNCGDKKFNSSFGSKQGLDKPVSDIKANGLNALPHCTNCGAAQENTNKFCGQCGSPSLPTQSKESNSIINRFKQLSGRGKFFYSSWAFINFIFIMQFLNESSKPVDRFRSVCNWEGVNCAPSSQELANQALGNLVLWNILFALFLIIFRKIKAKNS